MLTGRGTLVEDRNGEAAGQLGGVNISPPYNPPSNGVFLLAQQVHVRHTPRLILVHVQRAQDNVLSPRTEEIVRSERHGSTRHCLRCSHQTGKWE